VKLLAAIAILTGMVQAGPIILARNDIGDNYYDVPPADLLRRTSWLGLFIGETQSHLRIARLTFIPRIEGGRTIYGIVTTPPNPVLLISGVPRLSVGPVVTLEGIDLYRVRQAELRLNQLLYTIRLDSSQPDYCDAVITLTSRGRVQKLFDATKPDRGQDRALGLSCDEPHFTVHWAGDLDRDGRLDMVVTFSRKYSYFPNQLLLSSAARLPNLVAEVGRYEQFAQ
jgi:hypothetical protein